ncbi:hypothetical protein P12x_001170 [Tundrisphaera lichenicola]|uniref:hypothetical protein n=1 Tax=Tundrisphaera lichenicola TaxID=2029860 RepID=UPI003EB83E39
MSETPPQRRGWWAGTVLMILASIVIVAGILIAWDSTPTPRLPIPNGYDDLTRAGTIIKGDWPDRGDIDQTDPGILAELVAINRPALDLVKVGLGRGILAHFSDDQGGIAAQIEAWNHLKQVDRLLTAQGLVAESGGRFEDASRSYLELMRLGQATTQGEMYTGAQLGWYFQKNASARLRRLCDRLSNDRCRSILRELDALDHRRVNADAIVDRWARWYQGAFHPAARLMLRANGAEATERSTQRFQATKSHHEAARTLRFLMAEIAIHLAHRETGTWPRSLQDLVPTYLSSVPIDPETGNPITYPASTSGELTDELGSVPSPDGEVAPPP